MRACFQEAAQHIVAERRRGVAPAKGSSAGASDGSPSAEMAALYLEQLRSGARQSEKEMTHILTQLLAFATADDDRLTQLLSMLPASSPLGCLSSVATALYHPAAAVRTLAAAVLRAVEARAPAKPIVTGLNSFLLSGYQQQQLPA